VRQASHILTLRRYDSDIEITVDTASALNSMSLGYAITVHKSQGSEWRKVFLVFHQSHATMIQRELLYTAVTRAKEELYVICEPEAFIKGIKSQRIKGNTLAEKAEYFKGRLEQNGGSY
jgi:exodeoxyribonuclease V alpha subunit